MVILAVVYMFNFVNRQILAILLPAIRDEIGVNDAVLGMLAGTASRQRSCCLYLT